VAKIFRHKNKKLKCGGEDGSVLPFSILLNARDVLIASKQN
jgi:hypothetical protein